MCGITVFSQYVSMISLVGTLSRKSQCVKCCDFVYTTIYITVQVFTQEAFTSLSPYPTGNQSTPQNSAIYTI